MLDIFPRLAGTEFAGAGQSVSISRMLGHALGGGQRNFEKNRERCEPIYYASEVPFWNSRARDENVRSSMWALVIFGKWKFL